MTDSLDQAGNNTAFVQAMLGNNVAAVNTVAAVSSALELWSMLERGEVPSPKAFRVALWGVLIDLPNNAFYRENFGSLNPLVSAILLDLIASSELERGPAKERPLTAAFVARQSWGLLLQRCCLIVNGVEVASACAPKIRYFVNSQSFTDYIDSIGTPVEVGGAS